MQDQVVVPKQAYADLLLQNCARKTALVAAKEKLRLYREASAGVYLGGVEYGALVKLIDEAIG